MKTAASRSRKRARRGPSPSEASSCLVVHDLKNLAARLSALCQNLEMHFEDPLFKPTALDILDDTVRHLKGLATDLRDREGRLLVKLRVNLNKILEEAMLDVRPDLASGVEVLLDAAELPAIWGDGFLLRRAFACAMDNALEAMNGRGVLSLTTSRVRRRGQAKLIVEIADNGPGMSDEFLRERLFCPFSSTKDEGLGLGVYTMGQVAELHGGTVTIRSVEGIGTRVRFILPSEES